MPGSPCHLRLVGRRRAAVCRAAGCGLPRQGTLGYCAYCDAVCRAARALQERLLELRAARIRAANPDLVARLSSQLRGELLAHTAARAAERGWPAHALDLNGVFEGLLDVRERALTAPEDSA